MSEVTGEFEGTGAGTPHPLGDERRETGTARDGDRYRDRQTDRQRSLKLADWSAPLLSDSRARMTPPLPLG